MITLGTGRYRSRVESSKKRESESETRYGQRLIRGGLPTYTKAIKSMVKGWDNRNNARWQIELRELNPAVVGFIVIRAVLDSITLKKNMAAVSNFAGARLEDQCRCEFLVKNNEAKGKGVILGAKRKVGGLTNKRRHIRTSMRHEADKGLMPEYEAWKRRERLGCGLTLVELLRSTTGIIEYVYILEKKRQNPTRYVTATKETLEWIENFNEDRELLEPFWLPCAESPKDWENCWSGGYDTENTFLPKVPFIKTTNMEFLRSLTGPINIPMEACNLIQRTPWKVNGQVLDVANWAWQNNVDIGELPNKNDELLPDVPRDFNENQEANRRWRQMAAGVYSRNASTKSKRLLTAKILYLANKLKDTRLFYPTNTDFRGRVYNIPSFLGVMGNKLSRGLLHFSRPQRLKSDEDAKWLAVQGANTWGNDKVTLNERWRWAEEFTRDAHKIAKDPTKELLWTEANDAWGFLAWCFEWSNYKLAGKIQSYLPVNMDASNNGLQILSMLTRDELGMAATNVLPTDKPADIYGAVATVVTSHLKTDAAQGNAIAKAWLDFGVNRNCLKRPVMCYSYGLTPYSNRAYVVDWYDEQIHEKKRTKPFDADEQFVATNYLAQICWKSIESFLDKPKLCMDFFQQCARKVAEKNRPLKWVSPSGFPVHQEYFNVHNQQVNTYISGKATCVKFKEEDATTVSKRSMQNGASPNAVHSIDSAMLHLTVCRANADREYTNGGIFDFAMIHDSYGTHSNNCDALSKILRQVFVDNFSKDLLADWRDQLALQHPDIDFPDLPDYGSADITLINNSTYFFS